LTKLTKLKKEQIIKKKEEVKKKTKTESDIMFKGMNIKEAIIIIIKVTIK